jgi:hypothetical protein
MYLQGRRSHLWHVDQVGAGRRPSLPGNSAHTALASFKPVALSFRKCYTLFRCIYKAVGHIYGVLTRWVLEGNPALATCPGRWPPGSSVHTALASFKPVALSFLKCYKPFRCIDKAVGHIYGMLTRWVLVGDLAFLAIVRIRL